MSYYCKKCDKIVSDNEVKFLPTLDPEKKNPWHIWTQTVNFYTQGGKHQTKGKVGTDLVEEKTFCGPVEEAVEVEIELTEEDFDEII